MEQNLTMIKGDTLSYAVEIEGISQDLDTAYFTVKKDIDSDDVIFQKSLVDGIWKELTNTNSVIYGLRIDPNDTVELESGLYWYDWQIGLNGDIFTIMRGILTIEQDVTNERGRIRAVIIDTDNIRDLAVTTPKLANGAVTVAKIDQHLLKAISVTETATGDVATYADGADDVPVDSLAIDITSANEYVDIYQWGINAFDQEVELGSITTSGADSPSTSRIRSKNYIPVIGGATYYYKSEYNDLLCFYTADYEFISYAYKTNATVGVPATAKYARIAFHSNQGTTYNNTSSLNYPSTNTDFVAYDGRIWRVAFGHTATGGTYDAVSGVLTLSGETEQFNPLDIRQNYGRNNFTSSESSVTVKYTADLGLYLASL